MSEDDKELGKTAPSLITRGIPTGSPQELPLEQPGRYAQPDGVVDVELGRGGMGRVLRLHDSHLRRDVAVKELLPQHSPEQSMWGGTMAELFVREARVLARLEHPGVVPVYELGRRSDGTLYYAMRRVMGDSLAQAMKSCANLSDRLALLPHLIDVVQTVAYAHSHGVVHRDLKPENIMVGRFGETQVLDWGLAHVDGEENLVGLAAGTPAFMSPEQATGQSADPRTDVWTLGVILFEVLAGRLPFGGSSASDVMHQVTVAPVPKVRSLEPRAPPMLVEVVEKALARDVTQRFQNAGEMAEALEAAQRARLPRPWGWLAALGATGLVALAGVIISFQQSTARQHEAAVAERAAEDSALARAQALADDALRALRSRDSFTADALARQALALHDTPLARGVLLLTHERKPPARAWAVTVPGGCTDVAVAGDLAACATLNGVTLFGLDDGRERSTLSIGPRGWQRAVAFTREGLVSGGDDHALHFWSVGEKREVRTLDVPAAISALSADEDALAVGLRDGQVLRVSDGRPSPVWKQGGAVRAVALSKAVVASATSSELRFEPGGRPVELSRGAGALLLTRCESCEPPGLRLFAGVERSVLSFGPEGAQASWAGHRDDVTALAATGRWLVSGAADGTVRWWFTDGTIDGHLDGFAPGVQALAAIPSSDGALLVATRGKKLERWQLPAPQVRLPEDGVPTVHRVDAHGWLLSGMRDGRVRKYDPASREVTWVEAKHDGPVRAVAEVPGTTRPDELRHLTGGDDGRVLAQRWNGAVETLDSQPGRRVTALAVSPDGMRAAWALDDGTRVLWSLERMKEINREADAVVRALAFAPKGRLLATGREDKRIGLVDLDSGKELSRLEAHDGAVSALAFSPDGASLVAGDTTGRVTVWDVAGKKIEQAWNQSRERIGALDVSGDARLIAAGSDDGEVYLYLRGAGLALAEIPADAGDVLAVKFTGEALLFAAGTDRLPHWWSLSDVTR